MQENPALRIERRLYPRDVDADNPDNPLELEPDPHRGLAMVRASIIPNAVTIPLPLDNRRSPGFRRLEPCLDRTVFYPCRTTLSTRPASHGRVPEVIDKNAMDLEEGGSAIPCSDEDPYIRQEYEPAIKREGVPSRVDEVFYHRPSDRTVAARPRPGRDG